MFVVANEVDSQVLTGVRQPIIWQNVCQKLHEKERNRNHASLPPCPLDPQMVTLQLHCFLSRHKI